MPDTILVLNAGSSSIKFQLYAVGNHDRLERLMKGQIEGIGAHPCLKAMRGDGSILAQEEWKGSEVAGVAAALDKLVTFLRAEIGGRLPVAVGHRVVHGGPDFSEPVAVTTAILQRLKKFSPLAPLHQPNNLAPIETILGRLPQLLQVACFDTAFHRGHPELADRFALPQEFYDEGVRRYGFHGLSYEYVSERLREVAPEIAAGRVVIAHLGSGASMCALLGGRSIESTMGFTALDGLPMGTRPGQLDPGVVLYLMTENGMSAADVQSFLYGKCGLKGLSGISNDVRELLQSADRRAKLALEYFTYRVALFTGMLASALEGLDAFVFTAGIGENSPQIREAVLRRLAWLGVDPALKANRANETVITSKRSRVVCMVIPTDEELMIARHTLRVLRTEAAIKERRA
jgi:acetate kinase